MEISIWKRVTNFLFSEKEADLKEENKLATFRVVCVCVCPSFLRFLRTQLGTLRESERVSKLSTLTSLVFFSGSYHVVASWYGHLLYGQVIFQKRTFLLVPTSKSFTTPIYMNLSPKIEVLLLLNYSNVPP